MFTGIIEEVGAIVEITDSGAVRKLRVRSPGVVRDAKVGCSIAVNGVCLTAVAIDESGFTAELVQETLNRSSLKNIVVGSLVNLERPMCANGRFDGHIVQGHVDGTGRIAEFSQNGGDRSLDIEFPASAGRYLVEKGSIAVDGISLTIAGIRDHTFRVAIIPHTVENTNLQQAKAGDLVNLEFDVIAKYVERMLKP